MKRIMDIVIAFTDEEGRRLSEPFMTLPSRLELPDYYEIIKNPPDISEIIRSIEEGKYQNMDEWQTDFDQLCINAQTYNEESSLIYEDSLVLQSIFRSARDDIAGEEGNG